MEGLVPELRLELGPVRHVVRIDDESGDRRVLEQVAGGPLEDPPATVDMREPRLPRDVDAGTVRDGRKMPIERFGVVGMDRTTQWLPEVAVRLPAEDPLHGDALVLDDTGSVDDEDEVRGILDEGPETRLAVGERAGQIA